MLAPATPKASSYHASRSLSQREKEKIVQLFDIERAYRRVPSHRAISDSDSCGIVCVVESRLNDLKAHLEAKLSNLVMYANNQITRLPPSVRTVTLGEFGEKYNGEINALVRGMASLNVLRNNPIPPSVGKRCVSSLVQVSQLINFWLNGGQFLGSVWKALTRKRKMETPEDPKLVRYPPCYYDPLGLT